MNKKYDIEFIKKDIAETNDLNLGRTLNYYKRTFDSHRRIDEIGQDIWKESMGYLRAEEVWNEEKSSKEEIINNFAEFFSHNPEAYFYYQLLDYNSINNKIRYTLTYDKKLHHFSKEKMEKDIKNEVGRLGDKNRNYSTSGKIKNWIEKLGKSGCDLDGKCENEWINLDEYQEQIYYQQEDLNNLNDAYAEYDFTKPESEMDEKTKKAFSEFLEVENKIVDYYDVNIEDKEKILKNKWIKMENGVIDFEFGEYAKNDAECLEKILLDNKKIIKGHIDTAYSAFSRLESLSNFNLVDSIIQKHWKDYPEIYPQIVRDIDSGKIKTKEIELLSFDIEKEHQKWKKEIERIAQKQEEKEAKAKTLKMKI